VGKDRVPEDRGSKAQIPPILIHKLCWEKYSIPRKTADINYCFPTAKKKQGRNRERDTGT